jgi:FkbM family methyltransferase
MESKLSKIEYIYIYGNGTFAKKVIKNLPKNIKVSGILTQSGAIINGKSIKLEKVKNKDLPIYVCVFNHYDNPLKIKKLLISSGFSMIIFPSKFVKKFNKNFSQYYISNEPKSLPSKHAITKVYSKLHDDISRKIFDNFIEYQKGGEVENITQSSPAFNQYLGKTLPRPFKKSWLSDDKKIYWINVGAYDGDTLRNLQKYRKSKIKFDEFICIEPNEHNFKKLNGFVKRNKLKAIVINNAISNNNSITYFEGSDLSSSISVKNSTSQNSIFTFKLDDFIGNFEATHINMDIEGSELQALKGAEEILKKSRPKLAISVYHRPSDIVDIPIYLFTVLKNYDWFMRCYGANFYDTVLYGIPKQKRR